ncbi:hypothetical protein STAL104432_26540 [Streptomyces albus]
MLPPQRPHVGRSRTVGELSQRHQIGRQPLPLGQRGPHPLQHPAVTLPRQPAAPACRPRTEQRQVRAQLHRAHIQLRGIRHRPGRHVGPRVRHAAQPEAQHQRQRRPQPLPPGRHRTREGTAVPLHARPARLGEHQGPVSGPQLQQSRVAGLRHGQRVHVVGLPVVAAPALQCVPGRTRQRPLAEGAQRQRLVPGVPHPRGLLPEPLRVQRPPPLAHRPVREVREDHLPPARRPQHRAAPRVADERAGRVPPVVDRAARHRPHPRPDLPHQPHLVHRPARRGSGRPGRRTPHGPPLRHARQMHGAQRQTVRTETLHQLPHLRLRRTVAVQQVLRAQRPPRRHRRRARQRRPPVQHPERRTRHHPVAQRPARHPHLAPGRPVVPRTVALRALPYGHHAVPGVVVEDQQRARVRHAQQHRHGDRRVPVGAPGTRRTVPQPVGAAAQQRPFRSAAQPEEAGVRRQL